MTHEEIAAALDNSALLTERVANLEQQLTWLSRQIFGERSERQVIDPAQQMSLGEGMIETSGTQAAPPSTTVQSHQRRSKKRGDTVNESGLRFDSSVPVETIEIIDPRIEALPEDSYALIDEKVTNRLAQRPGSYVGLRTVRKVAKVKATGTILCAPAPSQVLERSQADVSVLAGMLVDKFRYHRVPRRHVFCNKAERRAVLQGR